MTELEKRVIADLSSGNFQFSVHAIQRSDERQVSRADVQKAAQSWLDYWTDKDDVVHIVGSDWNEEEIEIRAGDDGGTIVITVVSAS